MSTTNDLTAALEKYDHALTQWAQAYPESAFPEPDLKRAHEVLTSAGMSLDRISAHIQRHVTGTLDRDFQSVRAALAAQQAPAEPIRPVPCWLVEKRKDGRTTGFLGHACGSYEWMPTPDKATRFVRRVDANGVAECFDSDDVILAEHLWHDLVQQAPAEPTEPSGCIKPDTDTHVYFYEQDFYVLSNFSAFTLEWRNLRFNTSEAAYHYEKFVGGADCCEKIAHDILMAPSAHEAFKLAERNKGCRRPDWDAAKVGIMRDILRAKAAQHEYVRRKLLATGDRTLVEDSWRDDYWGWGPNRTGQNVLGKLWMEVRHELRAIDAAMAAQGENK